MTCILLAVVFIGLLILQPDAPPTTFSSSVVVQRSPEEAWSRLSDLSTAHNYVPGIVRTEIITDPRKGVGASRRVYSSPTDFINETVIGWEDNKGFDLRLHDDNGRAPMPFKVATFSYRLRDSDNSSTTIELSLSVVFRGGLVGAWLAQHMLAPTIQERTDVIANRLQAFYES